jgi:4-amino-4-deoxy-L-arabinose transferase-like glycosyltransferase
MNAAARPRLGGRIWPAILFLAALALYLFTLAPDVLPADNGEFQLVAAVLGVAHPPGYPLHTLLGALLARLPIGTIPWRVNLLSALVAAATLVLVYATVRRLTGRPVAAVAAALVLGTSTTFWAQATMTNVRTMAAFFTMLAVYALVRHAQAIAPAPDVYPARYLAMFVAALVLGLSHHLSLAFIGLCLVVCLLLVDPQLARQPRRWPRPALVAGLSLLPLLYLPLRAGATLAPPDLATLPGFLRHVLARGFSGDFFYFVAPAELAARLAVMGNVLTFQFHPVVLAAGVAAVLVLLGCAVRRQRPLDRPLALLLLGAFTVHTLVSATYRAPQTVEYMLPAYTLGAVILGYGLGSLPAPRFLGRLGSHVVVPFVTTLVIIFGLVQASDHLSDYRCLAQSTDARDYANPILERAPAGAIVLADWHWAMPLRYLQKVEHLRPDLTIEYVSPTAEPYEETWARRIREELPSRPVVVTHYHELAYARLPVVFEPLGEAFLARTEPRQALPAGYTALETTFEDTLTIHGYRVTDDASTRTVTLAWSLQTEPSAPLTLFVHLVGYDGAIYAQDDRVLATSLAGPGDLILTRFRLVLRPGALPGRYSLRAGVYDSEGTLLSGHGEERAELLSIELAPSDEPFFTSRPRRSAVGDGLWLVGIDWDLTLPQQPRLYLHWRARDETEPAMLVLLDGEAVEGQLELPGLPAGSYQTTVHTLPAVPSQPALEAVFPTGEHRISLPPPHEGEQYVPFAEGIIYRGASSYSPLQSRSGPRLHFAASYPIQRDYVVSTSLIGLNPDGTWAWRVLDDSVPAMGAIPTLKWIGGSRITDPHALSIPEEAGPEPVIGTLIVYDAFTGRVLPVLDERLAAAAPWVPLGEWPVDGPVR